MPSVCAHLHRLQHQFGPTSSPVNRFVTRVLARSLPSSRQMNLRLLSFCAFLWGVGFSGMFVAKGAFGFGPGDLAFNLPSLIWAVGGLSYLAIGALGIACPDRSS